MAHDVFISHSSHDRAVAEQARAALEAAGHVCWIAPRDITPGQDYGEAIVDAIRACPIFLLIVSSASVGSPQVRRETERAANADSAIIPFRIEDVQPSKALEFFISSAHWLDAITPPLERHLDYLVAVVGRLLSEEQGKALPPLPQRAVAAPARTGISKLAIPIAAIAAGSLVAGVAIWRGTSAPATQPTNVSAGVAASIFIRRAVPMDNNKPVRLRGGPSLTAPEVGVIGTDEVFRVAPRNGDWWPAQRANGQQGFVHAAFVNVIDGPETAPPEGNEGAPVGAAPDNRTAPPESNSGEPVGAAPPPENKQ